METEQHETAHQGISALLGADIVHTRRTLYLKPKWQAWHPAVSPDGTPYRKFLAERDRLVDLVAHLETGEL